MDVRQRYHVDSNWHPLCNTSTGTRQVEVDTAVEAPDLLIGWTIGLGETGWKYGSGGRAARRLL